MLVWRRVLNPEYMYDRRSPIGYFGRSTGAIFNYNVELFPTRSTRSRDVRDERPQRTPMTTKHTKG